VPADQARIKVVVSVGAVRYAREDVMSTEYRMLALGLPAEQKMSKTPGGFFLEEVGAAPLLREAQAVPAGTESDAIERGAGGCEPPSPQPVRRIVPV